MTSETNILVIDDSTDINYCKSNICNKHPLTSVTLDELMEIYQNESDNLFRYNTENCILLILNDGSEIPLHKYRHWHKPLFIKIFNKHLKENNAEIILSLNGNLYTHGFSWHPKLGEGKRYRLQDKKDYLLIHGYKICQDIFKAFKKTKIKSEELPAIEYCISKKVKIKNIMYKGYLPSSAQLIFLSRYFKIINQIAAVVTKPGNTVLSIYMRNASSTTEYSHDGIYTVSFENMPIKNISSKRAAHDTYPFFHQSVIF